METLFQLALTAPLLLGLLALSGVGHRWVDILLQFTAPVLILTALLMAAIVGARMWAATLHGLAAIVALALAVAPQWFPASAPPLPGAPVARIYSANVQALNTDVDGIRLSLLAANADVVVLIEVGDAPAARLDQVLADYPYRIASPRIDRPSGAARSVVASRWPLAVIRDRPDGLHAVGATIRTPLGPLNVLGVHLTRPWPFQEQWGQISQTMALEAVVSDLTGPVVVAGDFNSVSSARIGRQIRRDIGLHPAPGFPGTWPSAVPSVFGVTIDQVWRSPDLVFISRRLGRPTGSDHRPVVTEVTLAAE
ncbi:MAG: endonuclease/exonuclease/phosphatase family protein [Brevundimonas sp.]|uniref:endonuclease/exonuclease/phosphatase family protein n=1 Tax=Brevundimonas sp. TaxID=1871086 RepID=UPI002489595F|nr:endonuclease/exonuclease/phosphatase family protein [Brevundimonas sp.]MDI1325886.1 endonuclease/exonuclease/phosphatase family protein [Brevundimonas sp.]